MYKLIILIHLFAFFVLGEEVNKIKIISLAPAATEELFLLDADSMLVGVSQYCQRPAEAQKKTIVGSIITVDIEKILVLKPDLLIVTPLLPVKLKNKLQALGINLQSLKNAVDYRGLCENFLFVAKLVGKTKKARAMLFKAEKKLNNIKNRVKLLKKDKVFVQLGAKPLYTIIHNSYFTDLINFAGGINSVPLSYKNANYSREKVLVDNPDHIFILDMGKIGKKEKQIWYKFKTLNAVKSHSLYIVDSSKLGSTTPFTFIEMLEFFADRIHPN